MAIGGTPQCAPERKTEPVAYSNKPLSGQTDQELAEDTGTGMGGQGSIIESQRRLRVELVKQQTATNRLAGGVHRDPNNLARRANVPFKVAISSPRPPAPGAVRRATSKITPVSDPPLLHWRQAQGSVHVAHYRGLEKLERDAAGLLGVPNRKGVTDSVTFP